MAKVVAGGTQGRKLLEGLIDGGETQTAISTALKVRQSSVSLWANGLDRPKPHYRRALERLYSIPQDSWFTSEERVIALGDGRRTKAAESGPAAINDRPVPADRPSKAG